MSCDLTGGLASKKQHQITVARAAPPSSGCNVWSDGSTLKYGVENKTVVEEG
jgi:hypothetical protein